jgi:hypothetical protein
MAYPALVYQSHPHLSTTGRTSKRLLSPAPLQAPTMAAEPTAINGSLLGYLRTAVKLVSSQYAYTVRPRPYRCLVSLLIASPLQALLVHSVRRFR